MRGKAVFALVLLVGCQPAVDEVGKEERIKIGLIAPLSGDLASFGETMRKAAKLAEKEINDGGGVLGKKISIEVCDDGTSAEGAKRCFDRFVSAGIKFIIGPATSSGVINGVCEGAKNSSCPAVKTNKVLLISPSATSPLISELDDGGFVWRTAPSDALQGVALAQFIWQDMKVKTVSVIHINDPYGSKLAEVFVREYEKLGGKVLSLVSYPEDKSEGFSAEVQKLYENGDPEGIVLITFVTDGNNILKDLRDFVAQKGKSKPKLFGVDGNKDKEISGGVASDFVKGNMWGTAPTPPKDDDDYKKFANAYRSAWGHSPAIFNDNTYDAVYLIALGIETVGEYNPEKVKNVLVALTNGGEKIKPVSAGGNWKVITEKVRRGADVDFDGASGDVDFDERGDVKGGIYIIWQIVDTQGKEEDFKEVKTIRF